MNTSINDDIFNILVESYENQIRINEYMRKADIKEQKMLNESASMDEIMAFQDASIEAVKNAVVKAVKVLVDKIKNLWKKFTMAMVDRIAKIFGKKFAEGEPQLLPASAKLPVFNYEPINKSGPLVRPMDGSINISNDGEISGSGDFADYIKYYNAKDGDEAQAYIHKKCFNATETERADKIWHSIYIDLSAIKIFMKQAYASNSNFLDNYSKEIGKMASEEFRPEKRESIIKVNEGLLAYSRYLFKEMQFAITQATSVGAKVQRAIDFYRKNNDK